MRCALHGHSLRLETVEVEMGTSSRTAFRPHAVYRKALQDAQLDEIPLHYTRGIFGPSANPGMIPHDYDVAALWIVGWCRRSQAERRELITHLEQSKVLQDQLATSGRELKEWVSAVRRPLDELVATSGTNPERALSLSEVTDIVQKWNRNGQMLQDDEGRDLLNDLGRGIPTNLGYELATILLGDLKKQESVAGWEFSHNPLWMALNTLRHWSAFGREHRIPKRHLLIWMSRGEFLQHVGIRD